MPMINLRSNFFLSVRFSVWMSFLDAQDDKEQGGGLFGCSLWHSLSKDALQNTQILFPPCSLLLTFRTILPSYPSRIWCMDDMYGL